RCHRSGVRGPFHREIPGGDAELPCRRRAMDPPRARIRPLANRRVPAVLAELTRADKIRVRQTPYAVSEWTRLGSNQEPTDYESVQGQGTAGYSRNRNDTERSSSSSFERRRSIGVTG